MGTTVIEGRVLAEDALGMSLVPDDDVVEAVPAEGSNRPFAEGVGFGRSGRRDEEAGPEPLNTPAEVGAVDRVPVMDEEARTLAIADSLDEALGSPDSAGVRGNARVHEAAAVEGENDEDVEEAESAGHEDEEVAGPSLAEVISDEGAPALAAPSVQACIDEVLSAPRSPWQNPFVERLIGSIRRECLDHVIVLGERHLRGILASYFAYYHGSRTHLSLVKDAPDPRPMMSTNLGHVIELPEVGGLHHRYERRAA
jgi:hypothetical protein